MSCLTLSLPRFHCVFMVTSMLRLNLYGVLLLTCTAFRRHGRPGWASLWAHCWNSCSKNCAWFVKDAERAPRFRAFYRALRTPCRKCSRSAVGCGEPKVNPNGHYRGWRRFLSWACVEDERPTRFTECIRHPHRGFTHCVHPRPTQFQVVTKMTLGWMNTAKKSALRP